MKDANSHNEQDFDLFGQPCLPIRDRRGRPSYKKTKENQDFVAVRAASGWSHSRIASALGCNDDTLRKHFSGELEDGRLIVEGLILDVLMRKMREGHVPAIRLLQDKIEDAAPSAPRAKPLLIDENTDVVPAPVGKKEQRLLDAQDIPDDWGDIAERLKQ